MQQIICPKCEGTGSFIVGFSDTYGTREKDCPFCNGKKMITVSDDYDFDDFDLDDEEYYDPSNPENQDEDMYGERAKMER